MRGDHRREDARRARGRSAPLRRVATIPRGERDVPARSRRDGRVEIGDAEHARLYVFAHARVPRTRVRRRRPRGYERYRRRRGGETADGAGNARRERRRERGERSSRLLLLPSRLLLLRRDGAGTRGVARQTPRGILARSERRSRSVRVDGPRAPRARFLRRARIRRSRRRRGGNFVRRRVDASVRGSARGDGRGPRGWLRGFPRASGVRVDAIPRRGGRRRHGPGPRRGSFDSRPIPS